MKLRAIFGFVISGQVGGWIGNQRDKHAQVHHRSQEYHPHQEHKYGLAQLMASSRTQAGSRVWTLSGSKLTANV